MLNYEEYVKSLNEKLIPFVFYIKDQYDIENINEIAASIKNYLSEYVSLLAYDRKNIRLMPTYRALMFEKIALSIEN